jgi:hypothetical protein
MVIAQLTIVTHAGRAGSGVAHGHGDNQRPDTAIGQIGVSGLNPFGLGAVRRSGGSIAFVGGSPSRFSERCRCGKSVATLGTAKQTTWIFEAVGDHTLGTPSHKNGLLSLAGLMNVCCTDMH